MIKFNDRFRLSPLVYCMGWSSGHGGRDGMGGDTGVSGDEGGMAGGSAGGSVSGGGNGSEHDNRGSWEKVADDKKNNYPGSDGYTVGGTGSNTGQLSDDFKGATETDKLKSLWEAVRGFFKGFSLGSIFGGVGSLVGGVAVGWGKYSATEKAQITKNVQDIAKEKGWNLSDEAAKDVAKSLAEEAAAQYSGTSSASTDGHTSPGDGSEHFDLETISVESLADNALSAAEVDSSEENSVSTDRKAWDDLVNRFYTEEGQTVEDLVNTDADHMRRAAQDYQTGIQGAQTKNETLLDSIISGIQGGQGQYAPMGIKINGMPINLGLNRGQRNTIAQLAGLSNQSYENKANNLKDILNVSTLTSPSSGGLKYLSMLQALANGEEARRQNDTKNALTAEEIANNLDLGNQRIEASEPGILDYLKGGASALESIGDIDWGGLFP